MLRFKWLVTAGIVTGVVVSGGLAYAAIPDPDGAITACYTKNAGIFDAKGTVRVIDSASECRSSEIVLTWNQTGQPGRDGADGEAGPQGPTGPAGPAATANVHFVSQPRFPSAAYLPTDGTPGTVVSMELPAGSYVLQARVNVGMRLVGDWNTAVVCSIPGADNRQFIGSGDGHQEDAHLDLTSAITHPGGTVALNCRSPYANGHTTTAASATLLATEVDSVG